MLVPVLVLTLMLMLLIMITPTAQVIRETAERNMSLETEVERKRDSLLCKVEEFHTTKLALGKVRHATCHHLPSP